MRGENYYSKNNANAFSCVSMVHESKNQAVVIEKHEEKYVIFVTEKLNPYQVIDEIERGYEDLDSAAEEADTWMKHHPDGLRGYP